MSLFFFQIAKEKAEAAAKMKRREARDIDLVWEATEATLQRKGEREVRTKQESQTLEDQKKKNPYI